MLRSGVSEGISQNELIKIYLVFSTVACLTLLITYYHIFECYAFLDDYFLLYHVGDRNFIDIFKATGRPVYGVLFKWLFSKLYFICNLKYARIVSLSGIVLFSVLLNRAYVLAGWEKVQAGCAAVITCLMPAYGIYAAWTTCFLIAYGIIMAFVAGELCLKSYDYLYLKGLGLRQAILFIGIIFLTIISLMIYQPSATAFWLFVAIALFKPQENREDFTRKILYCFIIFTLSVTVYFVLYKLELWPFMADFYKRSGLTKNPLEKIQWFMKYPLYDSLSLFNILQGKTVIAITVTAVSTVILGGLFFRIRRSRQQRWLFLLIFLGLIPVSYLPNLASSECFGGFRTIGVLGSLIVFYLLLSLKEIFKNNVIIIIFPALAAVFSLMAYYNVTHGFVEPQKQELELIRHALREPLSKQPEEIIFIMSNWKDSIASSTSKLRVTEYGVPSTFEKWVPDGLTNLIARENNGEVHNPIKVRIYRHDETFSSEHGTPVINAGKLLQGYMQDRLKNKFNKSTDIRLLLNCEEGFGGLKALHQVSFLYRSKGLLLRSTGQDPYVVLPLFNFFPKSPLVFKIVITSPEDTVLKIYYATKSVPLYNEEQSIGKRLEKGNNVVFIQLPLRGYTGHLRLDPGNIVGDFLLHAIEIRGS